MEFFFRNQFVINPDVTQLCKHILNGRNVALFARRRFGKLHPDSLPKFDETKPTVRNISATLSSVSGSVVTLFSKRFKYYLV